MSRGYDGHHEGQGYSTIYKTQSKDVHTWSHNSKGKVLGRVIVIIGIRTRDEKSMSKIHWLLDKVLEFETDLEGVRMSGKN